jgi:hypothetical protein
MPAIETGNEIFYEAPDAEVSVAASLLDTFAPVPYLRLQSLRLAAAPEIDEARFRYVYGPQFREDGGISLPAVPTTFGLGTYPPLDLNNQIVRIEIPATVVGDDPIVWHGVVEIDERDVDGSQADPGAPAGLQTITTYGLLRLLEKTRVTQSVIENAGTIERALPFNRDRGGPHYDRGNRETIADTTTNVHKFGEHPRGAITWTAQQAVEYTLFYDAPPITRLVVAVKWVVKAPENTLDWADFSVDRQDRSVKEILDQLIPRQRGLGYWLSYDETLEEIHVNVFSFAGETIVLPSGNTLAKNPDQFSLDFENALDIERAVIRRMATQQYDRIVVRGAWRTSTATFRLYDSAGHTRDLETDWTAAEETAYRDGFSGSGDYGPDLTDKERQNDVVRQSDRFRHVYARFALRAAHPGWVRTETDPSDPGGTPLVDYWLAPPFDEFGDVVVGGDISDPDNAASGVTIWNQGLRFEPRLVLRERLDYGANQIANGTFADSALAGREDYLPPLVFAAPRDLFDDPIQGFEQLDRLKNSNEKNGRNFNCSVRVLPSGPYLEIKADRANHLLALTDWETQAPAPTAEDSDPTKQNGLDFADDFLRATLTVRLDERVTAEVVIGLPVAGERFERVRWIDAGEHYRLDWVVPNTIVQLNEFNQPRTTTGGFVRDDRDKLADIARAAEEWYGKPRQALQLEYKQARNLFQLGWLIAGIGPNYTEDDPTSTTLAVNSVITALQFDFPEGDEPPTTTVETNYTELDFT